jgi:hypothetical protein
MNQNSEYEVAHEKVVIRHQNAQFAVLLSKVWVAVVLKEYGVFTPCLMDPQGIVRWEGFPFLAGYPLTGNVVADIIARYSN